MLGASGGWSNSHLLYKVERTVLPLLVDDGLLSNVKPRYDTIFRIASPSTSPTHCTKTFDVPINSNSKEGLTLETPVSEPASDSKMQPRDPPNQAIPITSRFQTTSLTRKGYVISAFNDSATSWGLCGSSVSVSDYGLVVSDSGRGTL